MPKEHKAIIEEALHKKRLDDALVSLFGLTKSQAKKAIDEGRVQLLPPFTEREDRGGIFEKDADKAKENLPLTPSFLKRVNFSQEKGDIENKNNFSAPPNPPSKGGNSELPDSISHLPSSIFQLPSKAGTKVRTGETILLQEKEIPTRSHSAKLPSPEILEEHEDYLLVRKPYGIPTHQDEHHTEDNMMARLLAAGYPLSSLGCPERCGVVHRLDKDTSGVMVFAKNDDAHRRLQTLFAERKVHKDYLALCHGTQMPDKGTIDSPILRDPRDRKKMTVSGSKSARHALTHFDVLERYEKTTLLRLKIETGRTHQIRVHLQSIGHQVCWDPIYGDAKKDQDKKLMKESETFFQMIGEEVRPRLALHAEKLEFEY